MSDTDDFRLMSKRFKVGDRVVPSDYGRQQHIVQSRVSVGTVVKISDVNSLGYTWTVTVQWDTYKRPHAYAACFIDKLKKGRVLRHYLKKSGGKRAEQPR